MIKIIEVIAFYYNSIGGNYEDTFGNTVTLGLGGGGCPKLINGVGWGGGVLCNRLLNKVSTTSTQFWAGRVPSET